MICARFAHLVILISLLSGCSLGIVQTATPTRSSPTMEIQITPALPVAATLPATVQQPEPAATQPEAATLPETTVIVPGYPMQFGLLTVLPGSSGSTSSSQVIAANRSTGVRYMRVALDWAVSEPEPGKLSFDSHNDQAIQEIEAAGLRLFPTLYVGRGWMNGTPAGRQDDGSRSYPPDDLGAQWDEAHGYSPSYYNFVFTFFQHYRGHFDYVAIENEANSLLFWGGTAEEYVRLLKTAYMAIKAADPQVIVADSGFVSNILGLCVADDAIKTGNMPVDQVLEFVKHYYPEGSERRSITTQAQLERALSQPRVQEQCQRINYMLDNMGNSLDAVNFHFYEDYRALPVVVEWLRMRTRAAGYNPAILSNEMGMRGPSTSFAESPEHARAVLKKLLTAMSLDLRAVIWFSADTIQAERDKVGLFNSHGGLRPAGEALKLLVDTFQARYIVKETLQTGAEIYQYLFESTPAGQLVEVLWMEDSQEIPQIRAPEGVVQALVIDYTGTSVTIPVVDGQIELVGADTPLLITWK